MKKYAFILGNNMALSIAEILAVFKREGENFRSIQNSKEVLLVESDQLNDDFIKNLGGTIKIAEIFSELNSPSMEDVIRSMFDKLLNESYTDGGAPSTESVAPPQIRRAKKKYHFGISIYDLNGSKRKIHLFSWSVRKMYLSLKKEAKKAQINLAYPNIKERSLSSASVLKNKLLGENGSEYSLIISENGILAGKTVAVQDIDFFSQIDFGRPIRDTISGTTPPKLATIMINLAEKGKDAVILDPFCGSGTFLQQMLLAGYKHVYGSDISEKAIADTEKNLTWLKNKFPNVSSPKLFKSDVAEISKIVKKADAIVSETYMGPPLKKEPSEKGLKKTVDILISIYDAAFREFGKILNKNGRIVLAIPAFRIRNKNIYIPIEKILEKYGFKIIDLCEGIAGLSKEQKSPRNTFIYSRPDQLVRREIIVLELANK